MLSHLPHHHISHLLLFVLLCQRVPSQATITSENGNCRALLFEEGDSPVCVCDAALCPPLLPRGPAQPTKGYAATYTSSRGGMRLLEQMLTVHGPERSSRPRSSSSSNRDEAVVEVACMSPRQVMTGFGGSLTDSAALTMNALTPPVLNALLRSYFSPEGLEYDLVRVPIGGSDFSVRPYTYDDDHEGDVDLKYFELASEDQKHKLPLLRRALEVARRPIHVLASPWSPPAWMKTNGKINETGELLREMWQPWAQYLVKFVKEYEKAGVPIWGLTAQNHAFTYSTLAWNSLSWTPSTMRDWIRGNLGPALHAADLGRIKLYVGDDDRDKIDFYSRQILHDPEAAEYVSGLAVHWYKDESSSPDILDHTHLLFPDTDLLYTESCIESGGRPSHQPVILGSWERAERYATNIIEDVNHFVSGWVDWNLALNPAGGPNWAGNEVDAPVIIDTEKDIFYKQPMFYVMGHFSKFVPANSVFVPSWVREGPGGHLRTAAFVHPDGHVVLQLLNKNDTEAEVRVEWEGGVFLNTLLPPRSFQTLLLPWEGDTAHAKRKYAYSSQGQHDSIHH